MDYDYIFTKSLHFIQFEILSRVKGLCAFYFSEKIFGAIKVFQKPLSGGTFDKVFYTITFRACHICKILDGFWDIHKKLKKTQNVYGKNAIKLVIFWYWKHFYYLKRIYLWVKIPFKILLLSRINRLGLVNLISIFIWDEL